MGLRVQVTTMTNRSSCYECNKPLAGKEQEFFFRTAHNGCGKNFCSSCLRKFADEVDSQNAKLKK